MVIGVVGKSCSGKDSVVKYLASKGYFEINVDLLGHEALEVKQDELVLAFGKEILTDNRVDRKKLGKIVFSSKSMLEKLNSISHPYMVNRVKELVLKSELVVINAALLESMGLVNLCNEILYVFAPLEERIKRGIKRDNITKEAFLKRNESQKNIGLTLLESGKHVITIINDQDEDYLSRQLALYCDRLEKKGYING